MGYTHYWTQLRDFTRAEWAEVTTDLQDLLKDVQHVQGIALADWDNEERRQPEFTRSRISFNGVGEDGHESFIIDRIREPKEAWQRQRGGGFCKTARKPYDLAVTAALCYLATVRETHAVTSDGHGRNFLEGLAEARRALPRYANVLDIPRGVLEDDRWIGPWAHHFTELYSFHFCVDGFAYIEETGKTPRWYRFASHTEAAQWFKANKEVIDATGFFDEARRKRLGREQAALFSAMFRNADSLERFTPPPAFVRPNEFPLMEEGRYLDFEQLLNQFAA
jgi:hypothetical protein